MFLVSNENLFLSSDEMIERELLIDADVDFYSNMIIDTSNLKKLLNNLKDKKNNFLNFKNSLNEIISALL